MAATDAPAPLLCGLLAFCLLVACEPAEACLKTFFVVDASFGKNYHRSPVLQRTTREKQGEKVRARAVQPLYKSLGSPNRMGGINWRHKPVSASSKEAASARRVSGAHSPAAASQRARTRLKTPDQVLSSPPTEWLLSPVNDLHAVEATQTPGEGGFL